MADDEIAPALTAYEWSEWLSGEFAHLLPDHENFEGLERHATAALCLYQQPFGFTHEDVSVLQSVLTRLGEGGKRHARVLSLKKRICALLPPAPSPFPCPWCPALDANTDEPVLIQHLHAKHSESTL